MSASSSSNPASLGLWGFANRLLIFLIATALVATAALSYVPLIDQNRRLRTDLEAKKAQLEKLDAEFRALEATVNGLQRDPRAVERAAREQGLGRPGETIIKFEIPAQ